MVGTLAEAILAETDLSVERANMLAFEAWRASSASLRRARLADAVVVPRVFAAASATGVLTMQRLRGPLINSCAAAPQASGGADADADDDDDARPAAADVGASSESAEGSDARNGAPIETKGWQRALSRAMAVAALSIVDPKGLFHADMHMGNLVYLPGTGQLGLLDFGVCGRLPPWLRGALLLQVCSRGGQ